MPERPTRIIAAILFTDIAGYTALMEQDESGTLRLLDQLRRSLSGLLETHRGQLVKDLGISIPGNSFCCWTTSSRSS